MKKTMNKVINTATDTIDKVAGPTSRTGSTVERVAKMRRAGISRKVISEQLTANSAKGHKYSKKDVKACEKIYADCETRVVVTSAQATALIDDQTHNGNNEDSFELAY